uniref:Secreted protein n=1 Tax=Rhipicephalus appendiculatus TaxID=34631 RepID=A0A131YA62_RHIAP
MSFLSFCTAHWHMAIVMCSVCPGFSTIKDTRVSLYIYHDSRTLGTTQHVLTPEEQHSECKYCNVQDDKTKKAPRLLAVRQCK